LLFSIVSIVSTNSWPVCFKKQLIDRFPVVLLWAATTLLVGSSFHPVFADQENRTFIDLSLYSQISQDELLSQAEARVSQEINRQFSSDANRSEVEIVVFGHRNGDVIPILTTSVSRAEWQANPQVSAWTEYYRSYALFRRHDAQQTQAIARTPTRPEAIVSQDISAQIDQAYDAGSLSGQALQGYLDLID
jgi:hypothetical protein